ncbi:MAG: NAD(P)-dependent oxidoreductase [Chloroflexota bacterium]|nr:NAD(P)-dependent oxidoreductase [Chloroflexota bacterium]
MTKVLITGGSGRFAEHVVNRLREGYDLVLFSRSEPPEDRADLPWIQGDLNNYEDCLRAVEGVDLIQHLGAVPWPSDNPNTRERVANRVRTLPPWDATMRTNLMGTYYLMKAAVEADVEIVVMTGSNCAFGHCFRMTERPFPIEYLPLDEEHPSDIMGSYCYTKWAGEELLAWFTRAYGIRTYVTRPAHIRDEQLRRDTAANASPATEWSAGLWGYVPSEDLAQLQYLLMVRADELPAHDVFVANALDSTALEPSKELVAKFRPDLLPVVEGMTGHQAFFSVCKAKEAVGWAPKLSWRDYLNE